MASEYKKRKLKSKFLARGILKTKTGRCKYTQFYTPSQRKYEKEQVKKVLKDVEE